MNTIIKVYIHTQAVIRMYKVPMDAFESSEGSDEESEEGSSGGEEEDKGQI